MSEVKLNYGCKYGLLNLSIKLKNERSNLIFVQCSAEGCSCPRKNDEGPIDCFLDFLNNKNQKGNFKI